MFPNPRHLRILALLAAACLVLTFISTSTSAPSILHDHLSAYAPSLPNWPFYGPLPKTASNATSAAESAHRLWATWGPAFAAAAPNVSKIRLSSQAGIVPIGDDTGPREPPHDRVLNSDEDMEALRAAHALFVAALKDAETTSRHEQEEDNMFAGQGVVMVGGGEYFGPAILGIQMLRRSGSALPVEVFVADASEWEDQTCAYLEKLNARCLIITDFLRDDAGRPAAFEVTHYQLKSLAMLFCSFAEVLYLDSDSIPLVNPSTQLFSLEPYTSTGLVIWPDFWISTESPRFWTVAGLPTFPSSSLPKSSSEAGQLLVDKRKHLPTLLLANYYNIYGPDVYYPLLSQGALGQGDKETFLAAATVLRAPWYRVRTPVGAVGRHDGWAEKGSGMVQHHPHDDLVVAGTSNSSSSSSMKNVRPAFLHANTPKMNAGHLVDEGDLWSVGGAEKHRLRLWGTQEQQVERFGEDLEAVVWELLVQTGCELQDVVREWKGRERLCERVKEHYEAVFAVRRDDATGKGVGSGAVARRGRERGRAP